MSGVGQISHDGIGNVFWSGNVVYTEASASQTSGATAVTILDLLAGANADDTAALLDAKLLTIGVYNNGTSETITGLSLAATGTTTTGGSFTITYPITQDIDGKAISIASDASQTFLVPLSKGLLRTWTLTPTFGTAPSAGSIDTLTTAQGAAGNGTVLTGSLAPDPQGNYAYNGDGIPRSKVNQMATGTNIAIWTPASGKKFRILGLSVSTTVAGGIQLFDGSTEIIELIIPANSYQNIPVPPAGILSATAGNSLTVTNGTGSTAYVGVTVFGDEE